MRFMEILARHNHISSIAQAQDQLGQGIKLLNTAPIQRT